MAITINVTINGTPAELSDLQDAFQQVVGALPSGASVTDALNQQAVDWVNRMFAERAAKLTSADVAAKVADARNKAPKVARA